MHVHVQHPFSIQTYSHDIGADMERITVTHKLTFTHAPHTYMHRLALSVSIEAYRPEALWSPLCVAERSAAVGQEDH